MANLLKDIQCVSFDTWPPMLDRTDFASWKQRIRLYCRGKENGVNILKSIGEGPFWMGTLRETLTEGTEGALHLGPKRPRVYFDLTSKEKERIKRYIETKPNRELIHYCLENPPYKLGWNNKPVLDYEGNPTTVTERVFETYKNVEQKIRDQLNTKAKAVQIILTGIDNDIYSTVDACPNACEMWKAIERLKQGESINVQDLETNLFWEFGKFTSLDGESLESYYSSQMAEQHQHEVNEIRAEKIARVANPLDLVAQQQQVYHPHAHPTHFNKNSSIRMHQAATKKREKAVVNSPQPIYDQKPSMVDDDDDTSKDKEIDKLMALISLSFKKIYKPTNNNLRTSLKTSHANRDNSPRIHRNAGYEGQRSGTVAGARETVGSLMVQKFGIQCYNCKEYGHVARECQKPKRAKDAAYH
nr:ribonuclease H-like domain-containing protein [Tanacetum cinerariifolium]